MANEQELYDYLDKVSEAVVRMNQAATENLDKFSPEQLDKLKAFAAEWNAFYQVERNDSHWFDSSEKMSKALDLSDRLVTLTMMVDKVSGKQGTPDAASAKLPDVPHNAQSAVDQAVLNTGDSIAQGADLAANAVSDHVIDFIRKPKNVVAAGLIVGGILAVRKLLSKIGL